MVMELKETKGARLNMELGCQLFLQIEHAEIRIKSNLIGMLPNKYLIIQTPLNGDNKNLLNKGDSLIIRYIYLGEAFGFESSILETFTNPFNVTFLSYPNKVEVVNFRKNKRIVCYIPSNVNIKDRIFNGIIADISCSGIRFVFKLDQSEDCNDLQIGDELTVSFPLLGIEGKMEFDGKIRNIDKDIIGISLGIEFINLAPEIFDKIKEYIKNVEYYRKSGA